MRNGTKSDIDIANLAYLGPAPTGRNSWLFKTLDDTEILLEHVPETHPLIPSGGRVALSHAITAVSLQKNGRLSVTKGAYKLFHHDLVPPLDVAAVNTDEKRARALLHAVADKSRR